MTTSTDAITATKNRRDNAELLVADAARALRAAQRAYEAAVAAADAAEVEHREALFRAWFDGSLD